MGWGGVGRLGMGGGGGGASTGLHVRKGNFMHAIHLSNRVYPANKQASANTPFHHATEV